MDYYLHIPDIKPIQTYTIQFIHSHENFGDENKANYSTCITLTSSYLNNYTGVCGQLKNTCTHFMDCSLLKLSGFKQSWLYREYKLITLRKKKQIE